MMTIDRPSRSMARNATITTALLAGGVAYFVLYVVANDLVGAWLYDGYSRVDQAISELSSKGAESRPFLIGMAPVFTILLVGCGVGVWRSANGTERRLQGLGTVLVAWGLTTIAWIPFPMTSRAEQALTGSSGSDIGHLILTGLTFVYIFSAITLGALSLGRQFRLYSIVSALVILATGAIVAVQSAGLPDGKATPWMGFTERISAYGMMLWVAVLAVALWRNRRGQWWNPR